MCGHKQRSPKLKLMKYLFFLFTICLFVSCKKEGATVTPAPIPVPAEAYYYPPLTGNTWDAKTIAATGWDSAKLQEAFDFAGTKNTFGLIVLQNGRIIKEQYWNNWTKDTRYYIASAGKSVIAFVAGIAQQEGLINVNRKTSDYLGAGWTTAPLAKENLILVKHNLSMSTGLDDNVPDQDCIDPSCMKYKADAGTRWAYYNAPYFKMQDVITAASGQTYNSYCKAKLFDKIGMPLAFWLNRTMWCSTREAARFGSLILRKGKWENTALLADSNYFSSMVNSSQYINNAYGYLWWLNGKSSFMIPQSQFVIPGSMNTSAPADMFMALGKDDKKIYVIPSLNTVVVRLGDDAGTSVAGPSSFDTELWGKFKLAMRY